ncbi:MAG: hypothetical protein A2498_04200 [Lentisphaerae bacterium RIFOXYC12_FULL_60_16]|nr:MAG: hypothetical protein A2498_04200 [Lentisphaerae bacterium RIFOXYC12_FULL_60_16]OGV74526.1 MAG: hypothetical protein A2269_03925 [Lentisphaerae bacterium RIFOXYA12_FULL_60_10]OGV77099.1 MAG: hypothetical protein A2340_15545 [Lentisphaerae bacterium RIFOXYB12_FULL_60_10]
MARASKRDSILQAAEHVFQHRRFHEVTLDEVATRAAVGKGTIYRYFKDKEDLFFQLATDGMEVMNRQLKAVAKSRHPTPAKLEAICTTISRFFLKRHAMFRAIHSEEYAQRRPEAREALYHHRHQIGDIIRSVLRDGVRQGILRQDLNLELAENFLVGAVHGCDMRAIHGEPPLPVREIVNLFLRGATAS